MCAKLYVGTYAKYNSGSIAGAWLDLEDYRDKEAFFEACKELHKDEADPELMFQDFEGFPKSYYSESSVSDELFAYLKLSEDDRKLLDVFRHGVCADGTIEQAREAFMGNGYSDESAWAAEWLEETGLLEDVPKHLENYIDFEYYARDAGINDVCFVHVDGEIWVFNRNY
jgi:antirestriction protein